MITLLYYGLSMNAASLAGDLFTNFALLALAEVGEQTLEQEKRKEDQEKKLPTSLLRHASPGARLLPVLPRDAAPRAAHHPRSLARHRGSLLPGGLPHSRYGLPLTVHWNGGVKDNFIFFLF